MTNTCTAAWFNDTEFGDNEPPHVHRCDKPANGHGQFDHECGYGWTDPYGTAIECRIHW